MMMLMEKELIIASLTRSHRRGERVGIKHDMEGFIGLQYKKVELTDPQMIWGSFIIDHLCIMLSLHIS